MKDGAIGVDIGGTKVAVGFVNPNGEVVSKRQFSTDVAKGPEAITHQIADEVKQLIREGNYQPKGVGVGMAGQIDPHTGLVHFAPNLNWVEFPFGQKLSKELDLPVKVTNDVRAAALGEWRFGSGKGHKDLVCLFVGTGIGGGVVVDGKMVEGPTNCAGELGHIVIELKGPQCHCGNYGCLEALAGGWAIGRIGQELAKNYRQEASKIIECAGGNPADITAKHISMAANEGDPAAVRIFDDVVEALIAGVISVVNGLNPSCVILGGGVIEAHKDLIHRIEVGVRARALKTATKALSIVGASLKNDAGIVGAASFMLERG